MGLDRADVATVQTGGAASPATIDGFQVLVVIVGGARCALPLDQVVEVLPAARIEPLPGAPTAVSGVLNLRGDVLPVLDGRRCLGLDATPLRPSDRFVVLRVGEQRQALRVDAALDVAVVPDDEVVTAASVMPEVLSTAGIARLPDGLLLIHDPARFLSSRDAAALRRALAGLADPQKP